MHIAITGASSGIGAALAVEVHRAGHRVTLVARRTELLTALAERLGDRCQVIVEDLAQPRCVDWLERLNRDEPVDVLVNNAGVTNAGPFEWSDLRVAEALIQLNLVTPIALTRAILPSMLERRFGAVVNISSVAAIAPPPGMAWYAASKAGLAAFSESLRGELRGTGVHVLTVYPGPVDNGAPQANFDLYGRGNIVARLPIATAAELAHQILSALERRRSRVIHPRFYAVTRWCAPLVQWLVGAFTPRLLRPSAAIVERQT